LYEKIGKILNQLDVPEINNEIETENSKIENESEKYFQYQQQVDRREKLKKTTEHKSKSNDGKNKKFSPNRSKLITIKNYNSFYHPKLPSKTVTSSLKFSQDGNEKTKLKGNLLILDKQKQKQVRSEIGGIKPSPVINVNIKKLNNWKTKNKERTFGNKFEIIDEENNMIEDRKPSLPRFVFREPPPFV